MSSVLFVLAIAALTPASTLPPAAADEVSLLAALWLLESAHNSRFTFATDVLSRYVKLIGIFFPEVCSGVHAVHAVLCMLCCVCCDVYAVMCMLCCTVLCCTVFSPGLTASICQPPRPTRCSLLDGFCPIHTHPAPVPLPAGCPRAVQQLACCLPRDAGGAGSGAGTAAGPPELAGAPHTRDRSAGQAGFVDCHVACREASWAGQPDAHGC